jgi:TonB family protein
MEPAERAGSNRYENGTGSRNCASGAAFLSVLGIDSIVFFRHTYLHSRNATLIRGAFVSGQSFTYASCVMGDLPLPASSVTNIFSRDPAPIPLERTKSSEPQSPANLALLEVLRQALASDSQSTETILSAVADAARVLSGANGTALAVRMDGVVVCRARSGDIAPEIGSPLNADSGISGECLRTAAILVCRDAAIDERVDPEVCLHLGIRSVVVVPLRGRTGVFGILEAFSSRLGAFEEEQINSLRSLAEIAETAYERERRAGPRKLPTAVPATSRPALFAPPNDVASDHGRPAWYLYSSKKTYWIVGAVAVALMLTTMVVRMSWRQTAAEIAASEHRSQPQSSQQNTSATAPPKAMPVKPGAALAARQADRSQNKNPLRNAADIESAADNNLAPASTRDASSPSRTSARNAPSSSPPDNVVALLPSDSATDAPPAIEMAASSTPSDLVRLASGSAPLPTFGAPISQGVVAATLIRKIDPVYPPQARAQRLTGSVTIDATIADNGSVRSVKFVSGSPVLAGSAMNAVRQWRYSPATLNGKAIEAQKRITLIFTLP